MLMCAEVKEPEYEVVEKPLEDEKQVKSAQESDVLRDVSSEWVTPTIITVGSFALTTLYMYFEAREVRSHTAKRRGVDREKDQRKSASSKVGKDIKRPLSDIQEVHYRRYQLRRTGLEIFFTDQTNVFFHFHTEKARNEVYAKLMAQRPPNLKQYYSQGPTPANVLRRSKLTEDWRARRITNFEYLMHLNTIAGRTFNDLTQYPVFPWVLSDYESETIDLNDPRVYRDLSQPVGALSADRLRMFQDRYNSLEDESMPKFHYGTHYSSSGAILFYLIRMEPFTTQAITLQVWSLCCFELFE